MKKEQLQKGSCSFFAKKFALLKRKYFYCCKSEKTGITYRTEHKSVHEDVAEHPAIMGHEFAGDIVKVGKNHQDQFKPGMKFTLQPALNHKGTMWSPGGKKLIYTHLSMPPTLSQKNKNCQSFSIPSGSWILTERRNYGYNGNAQKCNCGTGEQTWNGKFFTD